MAGEDTAELHVKACCLLGATAYHSVESDSLTTLRGFHAWDFEVEEVFGGVVAQRGAEILLTIGDFLKFGAKLTFEGF